MDHLDLRVPVLTKASEIAESGSEMLPESPREKEVVSVSIALLLPGGSPRSEGVDQQHVIRLMEAESPLPAILVDRRTMRVIDGRHRLLAALLNGQSSIDVRFFDGNPEDAFLRAVEANARHGLPLSQADRRAAATRIIGSHPQMSDRAIARAAGLGAKTVAAIRRRSTDVLPQLDARVGRDGKVRPLSSEEGRLRAAEMLAERPGASLREVARLAGVSPGTVSDVRRRLEAGDSPVVTRAVSAGIPMSVVNVSAKQSSSAKVARAAEHRDQRPVDPVPVLEKLLRDPSLRQKEQGRHLLRLLQQNAIGTEEWSGLTAVVPAHCGGLVVNLARRLAETWLEFAQELDGRAKAGPGALTIKVSAGESLDHR